MSKRPHSKRRGRVWKIVLITLAVLIAIRIALPYIVLHYANKTLAEMDGYYGHVEDVDLHIYRGAYQLDSLYINKVDSASGDQTEFFSSRMIDLSVEWQALFDGKIVGELEFQRPKLVFTKDKAELTDVAKDTNDFRKILKDFMPLKVNRFEVFNGSIHYADETANPKIDISLDSTHILAYNLTNAEKSGDTLPSTVTATAYAYEGSLDFKMKLNPLAEDPTFDLEAEMEGLNLVLLNDYLKTYGNFDINKGTFGLYTEFAAKEGKFAGYVKPIIKDLDVVGPEDKDDKFFDKLWEGVVGAAGVILKNPKKDQVATKVPIEGEFSNTSIDTWEAVFELLKNAFIQALLPQIDQQVNIETVDEEVEDDKPGLLKRIFTNEDKKNKKVKKEERKENGKEKKDKKKKDK